MSLEVDKSWDEILAKVDEILGEERTRKHTFSGAPIGNVERETIEILPHGARRIRVQYPGWEDDNEEE